MPTTSGRILEWRTCISESGSDVQSLSKFWVQKLRANPVRRQTTAPDAGLNGESKLVGGRKRPESLRTNHVVCRASRFALWGQSSARDIFRGEKPLSRCSMATTQPFRRMPLSWPVSHSCHALPRSRLADYENSKLALPAESNLDRRWPAFTSRIETEKPSVSVPSWCWSGGASRACLLPDRPSRICRAARALESHTRQAQLPAGRETGATLNSAETAEGGFQLLPPEFESGWAPRRTGGARPWQTMQRTALLALLSVAAVRADTVVDLCVPATFLGGATSGWTMYVPCNAALSCDLMFEHADVRCLWLFAFVVLSSAGSESGLGNAAMEPWRCHQTRPPALLTPSPTRRLTTTTMVRAGQTPLPTATWPCRATSARRRTRPRPWPPRRAPPSPREPTPT
eukprot:scaffold770_cov255-Pinguiococcus_pyrenoidosus.AAC.70